MLLVGIREWQKSAHFGWGDFYEQFQGCRTDRGRLETLLLSAQCMQGTKVIYALSIMLYRA